MSLFRKLRPLLVVFAFSSSISPLVFAENNKPAFSPEEFEAIREELNEHAFQQAALALHKVDDVAKTKGVGLSSPQRGLAMDILIGYYKRKEFDRRFPGFNNDPNIIWAKSKARSGNTRVLGLVGEFIAKDKNTGFEHLVGARYFDYPVSMLETRLRDTRKGVLILDDFTEFYSHPIRGVNGTDYIDWLLRKPIPNLTVIVLDDQQLLEGLDEKVWDRIGFVAGGINMVCENRLRLN